MSFRKRPEVRLNQAVVLLAGGVVLALVVAPEPRRFYWTPLILGLAFLGAALVGGRSGGHWAAGCALTGWGAAVFVAGAVRPDLDVAGLYLAGAGFGAAAALWLGRKGVEVEPMGLALTIAAVGVVLALTTKVPGVLEEARTYAGLLAAVGLANVALALREWNAGES